ncbi:MAG: AAA family ATPase [Deltaproteobacteria bacterium]|nr:AAA family ATPase [Deltaproteobacteria bacterium]
MEPVKRYRKSGQEHFLKYLRDVPDMSPRAIYARMEELGYRGQTLARQAMSLMAYRHVRRIKRIHLDGANRQEMLPKTNSLLMGPTGSGKTHLVEVLFQQILKLPTAIIDITTYSETGYVGQDASTILTRLLQAADDNPLLAQVGIVCLDEFDKIASGQNSAVFAGAGTTKDVTGLGVQRELLKMLESSEVVVPLEMGHSSYSDNVMMSTADVAFVAAGAFSGFHSISRQRKGFENIGFGREGGAKLPSSGTGFTVQDVEHISSFQTYGFLPELMARFSRVIPFEALDHSTLLSILNDNVVAKLVAEYADEGFELQLDNDVLEHVVKESLDRETGARGLASVLTRRLETTAFDIFAEHDGGRVHVVIEGGDVVVRFEAVGG